MPSRGLDKRQMTREGERERESQVNTCCQYNIDDDDDDDDF